MLVILGAEDVAWAVPMRGSTGEVDLKILVASALAKASTSCSNVAGKLSLASRYSIHALQVG